MTSIINLHNQQPSPIFLSLISFSFTDLDCIFYSASRLKSLFKRVSRTSSEFLPSVALNWAALWDKLCGLIKMHLQQPLTHCVGSWEPLWIRFLHPPTPPCLDSLHQVWVRGCFISAVTQPQGQLKVLGKPLYPSTPTLHSGLYLHLNVSIHTACTAWAHACCML